MLSTPSRPDGRDAILKRRFHSLFVRRVTACHGEMAVQSVNVPSRICGMDVAPCDPRPMDDNVAVKSLPGMRLRSSRLPGHADDEARRLCCCARRRTAAEVRAASSAPPILRKARTRRQPSRATARCRATTLIALIVQVFGRACGDTRRPLSFSQEFIRARHVGEFVQR